MSDNKKFIDGIFIEEKEGQYGTYLSIGITEEGLENIQNLPPSAKGFRNITAFRQKSNDMKFSAFPPMPKGSSNQSSSGQRRQERPAAQDDTDDLPF